MIGRSGNISESDIDRLLLAAAARCGWGQRGRTISGRGAQINAIYTSLLAQAKLFSVRLLQTQIIS